MADDKPTPDSPAQQPDESDKRHEERLAKLIHEHSYAATSRYFDELGEKEKEQAHKDEAKRKRSGERAGDGDGGTGTRSTGADDKASSGSSSSGERNFVDFLYGKRSGS